MAKIYLSSTFEDLKEHRRIIYDMLRKVRHDVIAMEDYVAADRRPVEQCLKDVQEADIYVGFFGFRYGYVPPEGHGNPKQLSITELEFQHARDLGKPCLTFIAKEDAGIPLKFVDAYTGDGEKGQHIERLRQFLLKQNMGSQFTTPHTLASEVLAAVTKYLNEVKNVTPTCSEAPETLKRVTWDIDAKGSPYPGLFHFTRKYAPVFFGRDADIHEILDRMRSPEGRFIIISGDSGVGKSSVVDAGILPRLEDRGLPGDENCETVRMVPSQTDQPFNSLMAALGAMAARAGLRLDAIAHDLTQNPITLTRHLATIIKDGTDRQHLVLFIDQMEELFTVQDITQSNVFLTALYHAVQDQALYVLATIRSDHLHYCHRHPEMVKVLNGKGHYALGRVEPFMMQDMIMKPAEASGLQVSETFARRLIHDTGADSANLPLLAFVLEQLFKKRSDHELSETVYKNLGGVPGAIGAHVKTVEEKIQRTVAVKAEAVLPKIFQTLAKVQKEEGVPTRNRRPKSEFTGDVGEVVDLLIGERLLRTEGEGEAATVSISHEKLFEAWPALKEYVEKNKKSLVDRNLLESRAKKWKDMKKPWFSGLATGGEYQDFQKAGGTGSTLTKEFLQASYRARRLWGVAGVTVFVLIVGISWFWQRSYNVEQALLKVQSLVMSIHVEPVMIPISRGTFRQGDIHALGGAYPVQEVTIDSFTMGKYEVTFEEYDKFAIATARPLPNDQRWGRGSRPVINVSWEDAKAYAEWLSEATGKRFRLPTESEWEYAARSGDTYEIWAGTSDEKLLADYAVYSVNSENLQNGTAMVGEKKPNGFGLHDMSGNAWEWVEDCWHNNYEMAPTDGSAWLETGGGDCGRRVLRGGSWGHLPAGVRTSSRDKFDTGFRIISIGFRLAQDTP